MIHFGHGLHRTTRLYRRHAGVFSSLTRTGLMFGLCGGGWAGLALIEPIRHPWPDRRVLPVKATSKHPENSFPFEFQDGRRIAQSGVSH